MSETVPQPQAAQTQAPQPGMRHHLAERLRRFPWKDKALIASAAILLGLAVVDTPQFVPSLRFTGWALVGIAPYLAVSVLLAAYLKAAGADHLIARVFTGRPVLMVFTASAFGALSPFCSCGVIPLIAALLTMGVPIAPVMAFWLSSPVMAPDMFVLTAGALGLEFAVGKTIIAFGIGLFGGFATMAVQGMGGFSNPLREGVGNGGCAASSVRAPKEVRWRFWQGGGAPVALAAFRKSAMDNAFFLGKWLMLAFVLESLMTAYLPTETVAAWLGGDSMWALPLAVGVGVPAYLNGYAAVPVVAGLIESGMAPGAGMAFMVAGAVTSIPAAIAVFALVKKPLFAWYLVLALGGSLVAGFLYNLYIAF